jgi:hypothetical protein
MEIKWKHETGKAGSIYIELIGEGIVWSCVGTQDPISFNFSDLTFKVKGPKHSDTKVTTLAEVDIEKVNSIRICAELVATPHRFEKAIAYLQEQYPRQDVFDNRYIGEYLKWLAQDIIKEETDTILGNDLDVKDVNKHAGILAKKWFAEQSKL